MFRRHHCRLCGKLIGRCCSHYQYIPEPCVGVHDNWTTSTKERCCTPCMWKLAEHNTFIPGQIVMFKGFGAGHQHERLNGKRGKVQPTKKGALFLVQEMPEGGGSLIGKARRKKSKSVVVVTCGAEHLGPWEESRAAIARGEVDGEGRITFEAMDETEAATTAAVALSDEALQSL